MANRLLNVRLTPEDERNVAQLRARGISISELMRRALRVEALKSSESPVDAKQLIVDMIALHPTPKAATQRKVDATDRGAVRRHIQARLRAKK